MDIIKLCSVLIVIFGSLAVNVAHGIEIKEVKAVQTEGDIIENDDQSIASPLKEAESVVLEDSSNDLEEKSPPLEDDKSTPVVATAEDVADQPIEGEEELAEEDLEIEEEIQEDDEPSKNKRKGGASVRRTLSSLMRKRAQQQRGHNRQTAAERAQSYYKRHGIHVLTEKKEELKSGIKQYKHRNKVQPIRNTSRRIPSTTNKKEQQENGEIVSTRLRIRPANSDQDSNIPALIVDNTTRRPLFKMRIKHRKEEPEAVFTTRAPLPITSTTSAPTTSPPTTSTSTKSTPMTTTTVASTTRASTTSAPTTPIPIVTTQKKTESKVEEVAEVTSKAPLRSRPYFRRPTGVQKIKNTSSSKTRFSIPNRRLPPLFRRPGTIRRPGVESSVVKTGHKDELGTSIPLQFTVNSSPGNRVNSRYEESVVSAKPTAIYINPSNQPTVASTEEDDLATTQLFTTGNLQYIEDHPGEILRFEDTIVTEVTTDLPKSTAAFENEVSIKISSNTETSPESSPTKRTTILLTDEVTDGTDKTEISPTEVNLISQFAEFINNAKQSATSESDLPTNTPTTGTIESTSPHSEIVTMVSTEIPETSFNETTVNIMSTVNDMISTTDGALDTISVTDKTLAIEEPVSMGDSVSTVDFVSTIDSVSTVDFVSTIDSVPTSDSVSTIDSDSTVDSASTLGSVSTADSVSTDDSLSTVTIVEIPSTDGVISSEIKNAEGTEGDKVFTLVETLSSTDSEKSGTTVIGENIVTVTTNPIKYVSADAVEDSPKLNIADQFELLEAQEANAELPGSTRNDYAILDKLREVISSARTSTEMPINLDDQYYDYDCDYSVDENGNYDYTDCINKTAKEYEYYYDESSTLAEDITNSPPTAIVTGAEDSSPVVEEMTEGISILTNGFYYPEDTSEQNHATTDESINKGSDSIIPQLPPKKLPPHPAVAVTTGFLVKDHLNKKHAQQSSFAPNDVEGNQVRTDRKNDVGEDVGSSLQTMTVESEDPNAPPIKLLVSSNSQGSISAGDRDTLDISVSSSLFAGNSGHGSVGIGSVLPAEIDEVTNEYSNKVTNVELNNQKENNMKAEEGQTETIDGEEQIIAIDNTEKEEIKEKDKETDVTNQSQNVSTESPSFLGALFNIFAGRPRPSRPRPNRPSRRPIGDPSEDPEAKSDVIADPPQFSRPGRRPFRPLPPPNRFRPPFSPPRRHPVNNLDENERDPPPGILNSFSNDNVPPPPPPRFRPPQHNNGNGRPPLFGQRPPFFRPDRPGAPPSGGFLAPPPPVKLEHLASEHDEKETERSTITDIPDMQKETTVVLDVDPTIYTVDISTNDEAATSTPFTPSSLSPTLPPLIRIEGTLEDFLQKVNNLPDGNENATKESDLDKTDFVQPTTIEKEEEIYVTTDESPLSNVFEEKNVFIEEPAIIKEEPLSFEKVSPQVEEAAIKPTTLVEESATFEEDAYKLEDEITPAYLENKSDNEPEIAEENRGTFLEKPNDEPLLFSTEPEIVFEDSKIFIENTPLIHRDLSMHEEKETTLKKETVPENNIDFTRESGMMLDKETTLQSEDEENTFISDLESIGKPLSKTEYPITYEKPTEIPEHKIITDNTDSRQKMPISPRPISATLDIIHGDESFDTHFTEKNQDREEIFIDEEPETLMVSEIENEEKIPELLDSLQEPSIPTLLSPEEVDELVNLQNEIISSNPSLVKDIEVAPVENTPLSSKASPHPYHDIPDGSFVSSPHDQSSHLPPAVNFPENKPAMVIPGLRPPKLQQERRPPYQKPTGPLPRPIVTHGDLPSEHALEGVINNFVLAESEISQQVSAESKLTLPPSLPNLQIIPFVAADAVQNQDEPEADTVDESDPNFLQEGPVAGQHELCWSEGGLLGNGIPVNYTDDLCQSCRCYFGQLICQQKECQDVPPHCTGVMQPGECCPMLVCTPVVDEDEEIPAAIQDEIVAYEVVDYDPSNNDYDEPEYEMEAEEIIIKPIEEEVVTKPPVSEVSLSPSMLPPKPHEEFKRPLFTQRVPSKKRPTPGEDRVDIIPPRRKMTGGTRQNIPFIPGRRPARPSRIPPRKPSRFSTSTTERVSIIKKKPFKPSNSERTSLPKKPFPFDLSTLFGGSSSGEEGNFKIPRPIQTANTYIEPQEIENILQTDVKIERKTTSKPIQKPILPDIPEAVKSQLPLGIDPILGSGIFQLSGCNIYGREYEVGESIKELSAKCKACRCTPVGVQCLPIC